MATVTITGNTYPVRDALKALGGRWNQNAKGCDVPADKAAEARALVGGATATQPARRVSGRTWRPCGYPGCNSAYCDECDGKGAGARY